MRCSFIGKGHVGLALCSILGGCESLTAPPSTGLTQATLRQDEYDLPVSWLPDRDEIVFLTSNELNPTRVRQVSIIRPTDGDRRAISTTLPSGYTIAKGWLTVTKRFAYFVAYSGGDSWLYRVPLAGSGQTERVAPHLGTQHFPSPDDRLLAWTESGAIAIRDLITGAERRYAAPVWNSSASTSAYWDSTGRFVAFIDAFGVAWLDLDSGQVGAWTPTEQDQLSDAELSSRVIVWAGDEPVLYAVRRQRISRYYLMERRWEDLATVESSAVDASWSSDAGAFAYWTGKCIHTHKAIDSDAQVCDRSEHQLTILDWTSQARKRVALLELADGPWSAFITAASFAPSGRSVAFTVDQCGCAYAAGNGLYVRNR